MKMLYIRPGSPGENCYTESFNASTNIRYKSSRASHARVSVCNTLGQEVATGVNEAQEPGYSSVGWNARSASSPVKFCRLTTGDIVAVKKGTVASVEIAAG